MATATETPPPKVWTTEDLLAMPDDGVERWIINGQLREKLPEFPGVTMTVRNRHHSEIMALVTGAILAWIRTQPKPRGKVYCGEAGVRLPGRTSTFGIDVVYVTPDVVAVQDDDSTTLIEGVPTLAVEILSPNDTLEQIDEKVDAYRAAGVPLIWIIHAHRRTVTLHRPGQEPELFNVTHTMPASPHMPGFTPTVAELFE
jgi:Uma2 family endonuclease